MSGSAYAALPLWDGVSPLPPAVPTTPYQIDAAGRVRVAGRFARIREIGAFQRMGAILQRAYASLRHDLFPVMTPLLAQFDEAAR